MSCVVIGAGIAGLSAAFFLQKKGMKVTVFYSESKAPASQIFTGILYRYPGRWGNRGLFADEGYKASRELIEIVESNTGRRVILSKGVVKKFASKLKRFSDVKMVNGDACIEDAVTIDMRQYLEGLKEVIGKDHFIEKDCRRFDEIKGKKIIATGFGLKEMLDLSGLKYVKGQQFLGKKKLQPSSFGTVIGRGHISYLEGDGIALGSTYEHEFKDEHVDEAFAEREILKNIEPWMGDLKTIEEKKFAAGVRVCQDSTYLPLIKKIDEETYLFTALGSRGLLYHAYYGKIVADQVCS